MGTDKEDLGRLRPADLVELRALLNITSTQFTELHGAVQYARARLEVQAFEREWRSKSAREISELEEQLDSSLQELQREYPYREGT